MRKNPVETPNEKTEKEVNTKNTSEQAATPETEETASDNAQTVSEKISEDSDDAQTAERANSREAELEAQISDLKDKHLRLQADFDNYRKRTNAEKIEMIKTASEGVISSLLPVIDDMERALKAFKEADAKTVEDSQTALFEGVELIYNKLLGVLRQKGVSECEVAGKPFNADIAEAVAQIPAGDESLKGVVLEVIQKGYAFEGRVIRFAKVVVGC